MRKNKITSNSQKKSNSTIAVSEKTAKEPSKKPLFKKKRKWVKYLIIAAIIAAVIFLAPKFLSGRGPINSIYYVPETVTKRDLSISVEGSGTIKPNDSYNLAALVNGEILYAPFNEGDEVKKGDLLYKIEATDVETNISKTKISLDSAKINYENILSSIKDLSVAATSTGQITEIYVDPGDNVPAGALLANIVDNTTMLLKAPFHSMDISKISSSRAAEVYISETGEKLNGTVTEISAIDISGNGGTLVREVTIAVKNPGGITESTLASAVINGISSSSNGKFTNNSQKAVISKVSGEVKTIFFTEGANISQGQVIMQLENTSLNSQLESAILQIKSAELSLKSANDALDKYSITAPISGTIVEKSFKAGDTLDAANASSALAVIYDMSSLNFKMNIDELDIGKISVGQKVSITADALQDKEFTGYVDKININGTTVNGVTSYPITIIVEKADGLLPGMNVTSNIVTEEVQDVLTIPVSAVSRGNTVLVKKSSIDIAYSIQDETSPSKPNPANPLGEYESIPVQLGKSDGNYIEVISGLSEGDIVYIDTSDTSSLMEQMGGGPMGGGRMN